MDYNSLSAGLATAQDQQAAVCVFLSCFDETVFDVSSAAMLGFEARVLESLKGQQQHLQGQISLEGQQQHL